jgi:ribonuclease P protein component
VDFSSVTRQGRRARCGGLVVYLLVDGYAGSAVLAQAPDGGADVDAPDRPARVGLIVGKSVGISVVRHRVSRRLRAQLADRLDRLPSGSRVVVRALPDTASASSPVLGRDLDRAFTRLLGVAR